MFMLNKLFRFLLGMRRKSDYGKLHVINVIQRLLIVTETVTHCILMLRLL